MPGRADQGLRRGATDRYAQKGGSGQQGQGDGAQGNPQPEMHQQQRGHIAHDFTRDGDPDGGDQCAALQQYNPGHRQGQQAEQIGDHRIAAFAARQRHDGPAGLEHPQGLLDGQKFQQRQQGRIFHPQQPMHHRIADQKDHQHHQRPVQNGNLQGGGGQLIKPAGRGPVARCRRQQRQKKVLHRFGHHQCRRQRQRKAHGENRQCLHPQLASDDHLVAVEHRKQQDTIDQQRPAKGQALGHQPPVQHQPVAPLCHQM